MRGTSKASPTPSPPPPPPPHLAAGDVGATRPSCCGFPSLSPPTTLLIIAAVVASVLLIFLTSDSASASLLWTSSSASSLLSSSFSSWTWDHDGAAILAVDSLPPAGVDASVGTDGAKVSADMQFDPSVQEEEWEPQRSENAGYFPPTGAPSPAPIPATNASEGDVETRGLSKRGRIVDLELARIELELAKARAAIRLASQSNNRSVSPLADSEYVPRGPIYWNAHAFHRSYLEMEKLFKVYVYKEGDPPLFHDGPCRSIYSMEGRFIYNMEMENRFRTRDPEKAHVHFLPFSITKMVHFIYNSVNRYNIAPIKLVIRDYVDMVAGRYRYWNRSMGADHFLLSCHDWGPTSSKATPYLYSNSIRVLCNANTSEGFNPSKDVTLPEINLKTGVTTGIIGGPPAFKRPILGFFAGGVHGPIRPILLEHWKGKDNDVQVYEYLPKGMSYYDMMKKSKFCLCPSGYEVASPRVVEAIYLECVPVIISKNYILPFSDVLNWRSFSVFVTVSEIPNLKNILMSISPRQYMRMQRRVKMVQKHFVVSSPPKRYDVYHMILHSIWLRRLNVRVPQPLH